MFSVIIPTFNEADTIAGTINKTRAAAGNAEAEIIVADGDSTDSTVNIALACGTTVVRCKRKGRATQMNAGATVAKHDILYFLHADSIPPDNFTSVILDAVTHGAKSGCFRLRFDYDHWFLRANAWFTRFNVNAVRFGDQSLFVMKDIFQKAGGYREDLLMMEDQEIISRIKKFGKFKVMNETIVTSARKYLDNGIYRMQFIFFRIWFLYYCGFSQHSLLRLHRKLISNNKL